MSLEHYVREEENSLGFYAANSDENLIRRVDAAETINTEDTVTSREFKKQKVQELKQNWHETKKCMNSLLGKWQRKLIKMKLGNGYPKVI